VQRLAVDQIEDDALPAGFHDFIRNYTSRSLIRPEASCILILRDA
jgi:hypothetical protein